jgi:TolB-like protein/DNA-binding SARP family transcriptional activator
VSKYRLSLLGRFELSGPEGSIDLTSKKLTALLAFLACTAPQAHSRDKLMTLLWGSHFDAQARQNLRQALTRLRRVLGEDALISTGESVSLQPSAIASDVARFEELLSEGSRDALTDAIVLYKKSLLAETEIPEEAWTEWFGAQRQRLEGLALDAMVKLGEQELEAGNLDSALSAANRAVAISALREDAQRLVMRVLAAVGRRADALKHYENLAALLEHELAVEPDPSTRALAAELRKPGQWGSGARPGSLSEPVSEMGAVRLSLPERPSIAVLPFANMTGRTEAEYFADGLTEDIITDLSKWRWFFVIARNSTFAYKGRALDLRQIGRELGVRYLLEGSVRRAADRIRITAQLIDATTGSHVWAERFDRNSAELFSLQDEIVEKLATAIEPALTRAEIQRTRGKRTEDMEAWDCYLKGLSAFNRTTPEGNEEAIQLYGRALELDAGLADAHAGLARVHLLNGNHRLGAAQRDVCLVLAVEAAEKALKIDDENAIALATFALAQVHLGRHTVAMRAAHRAVELNPNFAFGYVNLASCLLFCGHLEEALAAIDKALRLSPLDPHTFSRLALKASALYLLGRYGEAIDIAEQSRSIAYFHTAVRVLAASYAQLGMIEKAQAAVTEVLARGKGDTNIAEVIKPFLRVEDREHYAVALRKAGLPVS